MKQYHTGKRILLPSTLLSLALLACNVPVNLINAILPGDLAATEVAFFEPTLVNEEDQVIGLSDYYCHDVDGILSKFSEKLDSICSNVGWILIQ